jgi:hypothetical protein
MAANMTSRENKRRLFEVVGENLGCSAQYLQVACLLSSGALFLLSDFQLKVVESTRSHFTVLSLKLIATAG